MEPKWWQRRFKAAANPQSGTEDVMHATSVRLFADGDAIRLGGPATHAIETLSEDIATNIHVMLSLNFHKQLRKALGAIFCAVLQYETSSLTQRTEKSLWTIASFQVGQKARRN